MTVGNMERSIAFYSEVLGFEKVSDVEVWGEDYDVLTSVSLVCAPEIVLAVESVYRPGPGM